MPEVSRDEAPLPDASVSDPSNPAIEASVPETDRDDPSTNNPRVVDVGFSHIALFVADIEASIDFYERFGNLFVMHRRTEMTGSRVAYLGDGATGFSIVLVQLTSENPRRRLRRWLNRWLAPLHHLGVGCPSREDVDRLCDLAKSEGLLRRAPRDLGLPAGYFGILRDPDGNDFELSYQQQMFRRVREHLEDAP